MQAFLHNPFENKMCDTCHQPAKDGKVVLTAADSKALCVTCHEEQAKQIASAKVQHPGRTGRLHGLPQSACRQVAGLPAAGPGHSLPGLPPRPSRGIQEEAPAPASLRTGCATCHEPHGDDNAHLLRVRTSTNCAWSATDRIRRSRKSSRTQHLITIFDGKVKLPEDYFKNILVCRCSMDSGTRPKHHPVSSTMRSQNDEGDSR